ncbi:MAG: hypothetical protein Q9207_004195 [Kuettlingeria erythrocarpa]
MASDYYSQQLTEIEGLLLSRKKLMCSNVPLSGLDCIIDGRMTTLAKNATFSELQKDAALLLSKVTQIRQEMEASKFNLAAVDELATRIIHSMYYQAQVKEKDYRGSEQEISRLLTQLQHEDSKDSNAERYRRRLKSFERKLVVFDTYQID